MRLFSARCWTIKSAGGGLSPITASTPVLVVEDIAYGLARLLYDL